MKTLKPVKLGLAICLAVFMTFLACSKPEEQKPKTLAEFDAKNKNPHEVAQFVFDNYDCKGCHTLSEDGKFGYTEHGEQIRQASEGCVSLLTAMSVIVHAKEEDRTPEQKQKAARFQEYGCTVCHQVSPGHLGLTDTGEKLSSFHMSCSEVQRVLNQKAQADQPSEAR